MCGFSFSGKSTLARKIIEWLRWAYISLDDINAEQGLWGEVLQLCSHPVIGWPDAPWID